MQGLSLLRVEFVALFAESLLFGALSILYAVSLWILVYRRRRHRRSAMGLWMTAIVTALFLLAGVYYALNMNHLMTGFVDHSDTPGGPLAYFRDSGRVPSLTVNPYFFALMTLVGDSFMAYRIYVVYNRRPTSLVLPVLLLLGQLVAGGCAGSALARAPTTYPDGLFTPAAYPKMIAYFILTLLTNLVTTSALLLGRLWWSERRAKDYRSRRKSASVQWRVMKTIIQSESVYSVGVIFNLTVYATRSNLIPFAFNTLPTLVGISFTMIITRIGLSEMLDTTEISQPTDSTSMELRSPGRTASPIAINVYISRTDDCEDEAARDGKGIISDRGDLVEHYSYLRSAA